MTRVMDTNNLLLKGVELMLFGMGFVFVFLILLIFCIRLMSALVARFEPATVQPAPVPATTPELEADTLAAIRIAIQRHRARRH